MDENTLSPLYYEILNLDQFEYQYQSLWSEEIQWVQRWIFETLNCSRCLELLDQRANRFHSPIDLVSLRYLNDVFNVFVFGFISAFGILTNIINFIVFYRQGILSDSCTVSLVGVTVADFLCCLFSLYNCLMNGMFNFDGFVDFHFSSSERQTLEALKDILDNPKQLFIQIACCISAFLALERFYSVAYPFKVKTIFTSNRTCVIVCVIFLVSFLVSVPNSFTYRIVKSKLQDNSSVLQRVHNTLFSHNALTAEHFGNYFALRVLYVLIITILNFITFWKVRASKNFRKSSSKIPKTISTVCKKSPKTTSDEKRATTKIRKVDRKEMKLLRMVWVILCLLVVSYIPALVHDIIMFTDIYKNFSVYSLAFLAIVKVLLETLNSSCNFIIYFAMSTRYRQELRLFCCCKKKLK